jgi:hypothetical protein
VPAELQQEQAERPARVPEAQERLPASEAQERLPVSGEQVLSAPASQPQG